MSLPEEGCPQALFLSMGRKLTPALNLLFERSLPKERLFPPLAKGLLRADHTNYYFNPFINCGWPTLAPGTASKEPH